MQVIRGIHNIGLAHQGCVLSIGNFDGVHKGHQKILSNLVDIARRGDHPSLVMIFEPQPKEFFHPECAPLRITGFREKLKLIERCGIDFVICVPFNQRFRSLSAETFVHDVLVGKLSVAHVMIGDDFRFGCDRQGSIEYLNAVKDTLGFEVSNSSTIEHQDERISSTRIREQLAAGNIADANELLGWDYQISGRIIRGDQLGRTINVPTANIRLRHINPALQGVVVVKVSGNGLTDHPGVANLGPKPTVNGLRAGLEVHLLDFNGDLYGQHLTVTILKKLRSIEKFESFDLLKQQIFNDIARARAYFNNV